MEQWIRDLINQATARISTLIEAITDRISWVYRAITNVMLTIRVAWMILVLSARHHLNQGISLASETLKTLKWLVVIRLPQMVSNTARELTDWALQQINAARLYAKQLADTAIKWAKERVAELSATLAGFVKWTRERVEAISTLLGTTSRLVALLLTSPQRMAAWVIGALVGEFWRYVDSNADRLFELARQRTVTYTLRAAARIEDLLSRLI